MAWTLVGVSNTVETTSTTHTLVTTGISGLQAGDLLIACIASRIASTTSITLPSGWTLVGEQKNNNTLATSAALPSGLMAYCVRGAANPSLVFTHPAAPSVAIGQIFAYRGEHPGAPLDVANSITSATAITAINVAAGVTTAQANELLVVLRAGGQESTISGLAAATSPTTASGATDTTTDPLTDAWTERSDTTTVTGNDTALSVFDAVKSAAGATGNITATASISSGHVVITGAFKIAVAPVTITGISTAVACVGPFKATNGAYYFFGVDDTTATTLQAYKSTSPNVSWASIATKTGFATGIDWISCFQVGNIFHLVITDGTDTSANRKYQTFDASTDTFVTAETIVSGEDPRDGTTAMPRASILVRSGGEVVVVYNSAAVSTSPRVSYKRRTGVNTWSAAVQISSVEGRNPLSVLGSSDRLHNFWTIVGVGAEAYHRHLTSANALGTVTQPETGTSFVDAMTWTDAGAVKGVVITTASAWRWTSADNPTFTVSAVTMGTPARLVVDNLVIYAASRDSNNDVVVKSSSDDGANWTAPTLSFVGGISAGEENLSRDQAAYKRGANIVFPLIVNDGGTLKYHEHILSAAPPEGGLDVTEGADTLTSAGLLTRFATLSRTEGADTISSIGQLTTFGNLTRTEGADTIASTAALAIAGNLSVTEGADVLSSDGTLATVGVVGNLSVEEGADVLTSAAGDRIANLSVTEGADVLASTGSLPIVGNLNITEGADVLASTAALAIVGNLSVTEGADVLTSLAGDRIANFAVTEGADVLTSTSGAIVQGNLSVMEGADLLSSTAALAIVGNLSRTEGADTLASTGALAIAGNLSRTEGADVLTSTAGDRIANLSVTEGADVLASTATLALLGNLSRTEGADTLASTAALAIVGNLSVTEGADVLSSTGSKEKIGNVSILEGPDTATITAQLFLAATFSRMEGADTLSSTGAHAASVGNVSVMEGADTLTAIAIVSADKRIVPTLFFQ